MARRISVEIEFENERMTREQLKSLRALFRKKYRYVHFMPDLSLINTGVEVSTSVSRIDEIKEICAAFQKLGFKFSSRCGLHLHIDVSDKLTLPYIKKVFSNIEKVQKTFKEDIREKISSLHHRFFPMSVIKEITKQKTLESLFKVYINDLSGFDFIKNKEDFKRALTRKIITHNMWIDLAPWFRKVFNEPMTLPSGKLIGGYGSIEIRGPITYNKMSEANIDLWSTVKSTIIQDLSIMDKVLGFKIINVKELTK